ncbi:carbohydrate ABC transporter substrate-binding protein, CUT1 family [Faunimonas pinastri]|uniref:Carbohydrate ABC transporter substrate-binding protein, CUT1 family n=1 Tax=Faunimonas pinastri TaxID=1855383 RepID=A0A1H9IGF8_9HYPH|nr:sugar ABC transporter substrate-binding protein [Faunimonas pinastri]SEQ73656.1 carbohydrate ABC transporter substrate-binding protein, CUT1 family [Faunimonas pinastri]
MLGRGISRKLAAALATTALTTTLFCAAAAQAEEITVLLPSFGADATTRQLLEGFTKESGIEVNLQTMSWDDIRPKIVTSMVAGTAPADAIEFDWSWIGQFGAAKWFTPLDDKFDAALIKDMPTASVFTYEGKLYGVPYANDFRVNSVNMALLKKAGITEAPKTPDDILKDAKILKDKKVVDYPVSIPLAAAEGTSTAWYFLTRMYGGELFDKDWKPLFTAKDSAGYKALEWIAQGLHDGLINPAMTGLTDMQVTASFAGGNAAIDLAGHPYDLATYNDPQKSKVVGQVTYSLAAADPAKPMTIALPEAMGIPVNSKHKDAAVKFIKWWSEHQPEIYTAVSVLPTRTSALEGLAKDGKLQGGAEIAKYSAYTQAIFSQGTPAWYSEFSGAVSATINQVAKGQITVDAAVKQIADRAQSAQQQ